MNSGRCAITRSGRQHVKCNGAVKGVTQRSVDQGRLICFFHATLWYFAQKLMLRAVSRNNSVFHHILAKS